MEVDAKTRQKRAFTGAELKSPDIRTSNLLLEAYFRTQPGRAGGTLVGKMGDAAGYELALGPDGGPVFTLRSGGQASALACPVAVNDGQWHHVIAEADRAARRLTIYVDGKPAAAGVCALTADASLANTADFTAGKGLAVTLDFLRIAQGTLADARTSIGELYAWQFDGPFLKDFAGSAPAGARRDAGAMEAR
jgi:hypothetical protein